MSSSAEKIFPETLAARQREAGSRLRVFVVEETGSTNADAAKMLAAGTPEGDFAVVANTQTAGRGRIGRKWASAQPGNLYLSCGFRPPALPPERLANFTLWLGVAVAKTLREKFGVPALVKWPNDVFCAGKKLAGMLTEAHADAGRVRGVVFGLGLNVNLDPATLPPEVRGIATSMRSALGASEPLDVNRVCAETLAAVERAYADFLAGTHASALAALWPQFDLLAGRPVTAIYGNEEITGTAQGVDARGSILIRDASGALRAFSAGDVTLKKNTLL
ncbi:MAG: biotin--[acetyl-CoA-carboxylase] ligase [Candidatus Spyradosoma sp.]